MVHEFILLAVEVITSAFSALTLHTNIPVTKETSPHFAFNLVTNHDIIHIVKFLPNTRSSGSDEITVKQLRKFYPEKAPAQVIIFKLLFELLSFQPSGKMSLGLKLQTNFSFINFLFFTTKIFEKVIEQQFRNHLREELSI